MTNVGNSIEITELAAALGWQADNLDRLIDDGRVQAEIRSLCQVGAALREHAPTSASLQSETLAALRREGMGREAKASVQATHARSTPRLIAGGLTFAFASVATVLGLLATGVQQASTSPLAVLAIGITVGLLVTWKEVGHPAAIDPGTRNG